MLQAMAKQITWFQAAQISTPSWSPPLAVPKAVESRCDAVV
jgi:hypothetical protein